MKNLALIISIIFICIVQSCAPKGEPYDGKWITQKYIFNEEYECDCTEEQKELVKATNRISLNNDLKKYNELSYIVFNADYTMNGAIMGDEITGTYTTTPGEIYLTIEGNNKKERLQIVRIGGEEFLRITLPEHKLEKYSDSFRYPDLGEVKVKFSKLDILLEQAK